jgi:ComF family protein
MQVFAVAAYEEPLKSMIAAKRKSEFETSKQLGTLIWHHSIAASLNVEVFIPVPLHAARKAERGFDQAEVLADQLAKLSGTVMSTCLKRVKKTDYQKGLTVIEKIKNVENAFLFTGADIAGKSVVLVDDLMDSGATLRSAAQELVKGCPRELYALVACRSL